MKIIAKLIKLSKLYQQDIVLVIAVALITIISFNTGKIYGTANLKNSIRVIKGQETTNASPNTPPSDEEIIRTSAKADLRVVASKSSMSKKYHFLWCPSAEKIKEENKIYFSSDQEAESRGYTLAGNCTK